jgi:hypothetical protein
MATLQHATTLALLVLIVRLNKKLNKKTISAI